MQWLGTMDGDNSRTIAQVATDNAGNVYSVGFFFGKYKPAPLHDENLTLTSAGSGDAFIVKQNPAGEFEWVYHFGDELMQALQSVSIDGNGNVVAAGYFEGTVDFDMGTGVTEYSSPESLLSGFTIKVSPSGNLIWAKSFMSSTGIGSIASVVADPVNNNIFIGGIVVGTIDSDPGAGGHETESVGGTDLWIVKLEPDGDFIDAVSAGGPGIEEVNSMDLDANRQLVVMGKFEGTANLNPSGSETFIALDGNDAFIVKLDNALGYVWGKQIRSVDDFYPGVVACDASNNIFFNGTLYGTSDFDPNGGVFNLSGNNGDFFVAKFKPDGSLDWAKAAGSNGYEPGKALAVDGSGNVFATGTYGNSFDINPDASITEIISAGRMYITKFSTTGELLWHHTIPSGDVADPLWINIDGNNNILIAGVYNEETDFSFNTCYDGKRAVFDNATPFIMKVNPTSDIACFGFLAQPASHVVACQEQTAQMLAPAGGTSHITYQWQHFNGVTWDNLIDQVGDAGMNGYEGTKTGHLLIKPTPGGDDGDFRVMVNGDNVSTIYSTIATLELRAVPAPPGVVATSGCGEGYHTLNAFSDQTGDFTWYIGHDDDGSFEVDEVVEDEHGSSLTRYFEENLIVAAALSNGGCESEMALVAISIDGCKQPPGLVWARQISPGLIEPVAMTIDSNNDVYIAGQFYSAADFDPGAATVTLTPNGGNDYFVAKYNPDGNLLWAKQTDLAIMDLEVGGGDDVYYVGHFEGTVDVNPDPLTNLPMSAFGGSRDIAIVELASDGTFQWAKQIAGLNTQSEIFGRAITDGPDGGIYITGNFTRNFDFNPDPAAGAVAALSSASTGGGDIFVAKYDENGNYVWAKRMGSTAFVEAGYDIKVDASGNVYTVGVFQTTVDFNPDPATPAVNNLTSAGATDAFIQKLDANGVYQWAHRIGGSAPDEAVTVDLDAAGNPVFAGTFNGQVNFNPNGTFNLSSNGEPTFVLKLAGDGTFVWAKKYGGLVKNVNVTPGDDVLLTGYAAGGDYDFDPGPGEYILHTAVDSDIYVSQLNPSGDFLWAYNTNASGLGYFSNEGSVVAIDGTGDIYVTGFFVNTADFDPTNCTYPMSTTGTGRELFIQKIRPGLASICFSLQPQDIAGCNGEETILMAQAVGTTNITYKWYYFDSMDNSYVSISSRPGFSGANTGTLNIDPTIVGGNGEYRVQVDGDFVPGNLNSDEAEITITEKPDAPTFTPVSFCSPGEKTLVVGGGGGGDYRWYEDPTGDPIDGAVDETFTTPFITTSTKYYVKIVNNGCGSNFTQVEATIDLTLTPPVVVGAVSCSTPASLTLTASGGSAGEYRWYQNDDDANGISGETNATFVTPGLSATETYYVSINDGTCESLRIPVEAQVGSKPSPVATNVERCGPGTVLLSATGGSAGEYRWYTQSTGGSPIIGENNNTYTTTSLAATTQFFVSINDGSCESSRSTVSAIVNTVPAGPTANGATICTNAAATLNATTSVSSAVIRWYADVTSTSPLHTGSPFNTPGLTASTTYHVSVSDAKCESPRTAVLVTVTNCANNAPPVIATATSSADIAGTATINLLPLISDPDNNLDMATLKIIVPPKSGASAIIDQNGQLIVNYSTTSFEGEDELTIEVCDIAGSCFQQVIRILVSGEVLVYNAVSPNGDGKNDVFHLANIEVIQGTRENKVTIFNRWGDVVFEMENYNNSTNVFIGNNNHGKELPTGTYYYRVEYRNGKTPETGYLSLKR